MFAARLERRLRLGYHAALRRFRPDAIVSAEFGWRSLNAAAYARTHRVPLFLWWEGTRFTERSAGLARAGVRRALCRLATGIVALGQGSAETLQSNSDIREFYLGLNEAGSRKSYHDVKRYKRRKRWLA